MHGAIMLIGIVSVARRAQTVLFFFKEKKKRGKTHSKKSAKMVPPSGETVQTVLLTAPH